MELSLVRHGESTWNAEKIWQGHSPVPLSGRGQLQAHALSARLFGTHFSRVLSSDLLRARQTAEALRREIEEAPALRELDVGAWSGLSHEEARERFAGQMKALSRGEDIPIGGAERYSELHARVWSQIAALREDHEAAGDPAGVLAFTHGGVIRAVLHALLSPDYRRPSRPTFRSLGAANTSITRLRFDGAEPKLVTYNDAEHLSAEDREASLGPPRKGMCRAIVVALPEGEGPEAWEPEGQHELIEARLSIGPLREAYALDPHAEGAIASLWLADRVEAEPGEDLIGRLAEDRGGNSFGLIVPAARLPALVARALGLGPEAEARLTTPEGLTFSLLRAGERGPLLEGYAVPLPMR